MYRWTFSLLHRLVHFNLNEHTLQADAYPVDEQVLAEECGLLRGTLLAVHRQQVLEGRRRVLQLLQVERLAPDRKVDVILR